MQGFRRPWRIAAIVVVLALLLAAAGVLGYAVRGDGGDVSVASAAARYEQMVSPVNDRCTGSMAAPSADQLAEGPCRPALEMFAAAIRNGVWPKAAMDEARNLATVAETHAGWLARLDAATSAEQHSVVLDEILAQQPLPYAATQAAARAFRNALGLVGGPSPLV